MDIPTSIIDISGTLLVRIPSEMVKELGLTKDMKASIKDLSPLRLEIQLKK